MGNKNTGIECLTILAGLHGKHADTQQIMHAYALDKNKEPDIKSLIKIAGGLKLRAKKVSTSLDRLDKIPLPAIIKMNNGSFGILAKKDPKNGGWLFLDPGNNKPEVITEEKLNSAASGTFILISPKASHLKEEIFGLKWFIPAIWKYKKALKDVLLASLCIQLLGLGTPIVMQVVIDKVLVHKGFSMLNALAIGLLIIILFEGVLGMARTVLFANTTNKIDVVLGAKVFRHLLSLPLRYFENRKVGDTIARVRQVEQIREFLTGAPLSSLLDMMFIAVYLFVMFFYSSTLSLIFIGFIPLFIILSLIVNPMYRTRLDEKFQYGAESNSYLVENVTGVQTVKTFALEPQSQKKWEEVLAQYVKSGFKLAKLSGIAGSSGQMIQRISDVAILWMGAMLVIKGDMSVGALIAFRMLSGRVSGPILRIIQMWQSFQQVGVSIRKLSDIFKTKPEPSLDPSKATLPGITGNVRLEGVRFRYTPGLPEVIRDVTFEIPAGITVGIVGRSGSGKSTLSKLLQRLYIPESGKILIDGVDISLADPAWLRRQLGVVLQESFLFSGTIRENICIHKPSTSMEDIVRVAKSAGAHDFITDFPEAYNTQVGERGSALSGGQKQRIAIARALLTNPKILIFDEATSALDYESERAIQNNLKNICKGRTVIIIAHRLSTLREADKIISMERGEIVEYGSHSELMAAEGIYHYLYTQQMGRERL
ncbi:MAG: type I secretion system permease/ATPase [Victivallales bacterium]|nr:type I secretion system permease/ATPase [Victivallales bacterium]